MSFCVIAVKDNFQYRAVFCRHNEHLEATLFQFYNSLSAAKCLIGLGDICHLEGEQVRSYCRDWGFNWSYTRPAEFNEVQSLLEYARSSSAPALYLFDRSWTLKPLELAEFDCVA